ncbi:MAG: hypothetical protein ACJAT2_000043 [Bacteriovoracaceae bacterium]|jgi:hypothetical protein
MEDGTYSNLGTKQNQSSMPVGMPSELDEEFGLGTIIEECSREGWESFSEQKLFKALCFEFKSLLEIEKLRELVQDLVQIDHHLHLIIDQSRSSAKDLGLEGFYQNLSTLFIRMALEEEVNSDSMKRAIEIALEEEIYTWQERLQ